MIKIIWDQGFKRIYQKKVRNDSELKKRFWIMMRLFAQNPFDRRLRAHKLTGKLEGLWAFKDCGHLVLRMTVG